MLDTLAVPLRRHTSVQVLDTLAVQLRRHTSVLYYVGYISRSIKKAHKCTSCLDYWLNARILLISNLIPIAHRSTSLL